MPIEYALRWECRRGAAVIGAREVRGVREGACAHDHARDAALPADDGDEALHELQQRLPEGRVHRLLVALVRSLQSSASRTDSRT